MALKYTLTSSRRESRPRSKRLRALGVSAVMAAAVPGTSAVGHTHGNLSDLDRISTDSDGYIHLSSADGDGQSEKAKAGYADMAYDLARDSPTKVRIESFIGAVESMFAPADATGAELPWADVGTAAFIKAKKSLFSIGAITAKGINGTQEGDGSGEGGASYGRLDEWTDYTAERAGDVLSAKLGWELHTRLGNCYAKTEADSRFQPKGNYLTADGYPSVLDGRYVNATGDTMTGTLFVRTGTPTQVRVDNEKDGGIESGISFGLKSVNKGWVGYNSANGVELYNYANGCYLGIKDNGTPHFNSHKIWHAGNDGSGSGLDADMLDGKHLGNSGSTVAQWTSFPTFASLVSQGYLAEAVQNDNREYFKALLKWICANYTGEVQLIGRATPNSQGMLTIHVYDCSDVRGGLPQHSSAVYEAYMGSVTAFGTASYEWQWNNGTWSGTASTATRLKDSFSLWGQTFYGNDVSGDMTGVGHIRMTASKHLYAPDSEGTDRSIIDFYAGQKPTFAYGFASAGVDVEYCGKNIYLSYGAAHTKGFILDENGNAGIGTTSPGCKLDVNGTVRATTYRLGDAELVWDSDKNAIHVKGSVYADGFITAKGISSTSQGSEGGGSDFGLMKTWPTADPGIGTMDALGANLGWQLYTKASANASSISSLSSRITALEGKNYLDALTLAQSGTGNAVTSVSLSADKKTLTVVKGATFAKTSDLTWGNISGKPTNFVTTDTAQEITGIKTFKREHKFVAADNTYTDPWPQTACAIKVAGKIGVTDGIRAASFIKNGGTSSQFLMADGSVKALTDITSAYVTDLGTSGNYLTWTKNGVTNNITVPYATNADTVDGIHANRFMYSFGGTEVNPASYDGNYAGMTAKSGIDTNWWWIQSYGWGFGNNVGNKTWVAQLALPSQTRRGLRYRTGKSATEYSEWVTVLDNSNYSSILDGRYLRLSGGSMANTNVVTNLDADLLDGKHLGNTAGYVAQWTSFPTFASLVTQGYLAEAVQNDNREYFKALLKWICANYTGEVQLIGRVTPNSQGMLTIHVYDCSDVRGGLPQHSSAVYEAYMGSVTAFGTASYEWQWNNGTWSGTASTATRLKDSFSLWGQTFYGNDVSGDMTGVGHIRMTASKHLYAPDSEGTDRSIIDFYAGQKPTFAYGFASAGVDVEYCGKNIYLSYGAAHTKGFILDENGNAGIGTTSPGCKLDVNGDIRAMGWLRLGTWGRMCFDGGAGWLQMAQNATNRITALNAAEMTRLEIKSAMTHFSGQITNANASGNSTTIAYGAIELSHATPYIDFHFGRSAADFDVRLINDEAGVLHLVGGSLKLGNGYIRWDSSRGCFALSHGLYSESFITAKKTGDTTASGTANVEPGGTVEVGGDPVKDSSAVKVQSDESDEPEESELEALRLRVAQLEQRINALTA